jgi:hypothetical protein
MPLLAPSQTRDRVILERVVVSKVPDINSTEVVDDPEPAPVVDGQLPDVPVGERRRRERVVLVVGEPLVVGGRGRVVLDEEFEGGILIAVLILDPEPHVAVLILSHGEHAPAEEFGALVVVRPCVVGLIGECPAVVQPVQG